MTDIGLQPIKKFMIDWFPVCLAPIGIFLGMLIMKLHLEWWDSPAAHSRRLENRIKKIEKLRQEKVE